MLRLASLLAALAVILGAMGAHGHVADVLTAHGQIDNWKTASHYHLIHAVALAALAGLAGKAGRWAIVGWWAMLGGVCLFSGSLYVLAWTGIKWLGAITPVGGLGLIVGWVLTSFSAPSAAGGSIQSRGDKHAP
jgi:uncharacterized membrane protein YgdD (TMEM256/DUF423 family)